MTYQPPANALFIKLPSSETGISFSNPVEDDSSYNILTYRNFYNGGGVATGDINNDGLPDIFLTANLADSKLYLNKGNFQFEDITTSSGIKSRKGWRTGVTMADVNADGWLDIYICNSGDIKGDDKENELYINQHNNTFKEQAKEYGLNDSGFTTHISFFDYDLDGDLDFFLMNHSLRFNGTFNERSSYTGTYDTLAADYLFKNDEGKFTDVSASSGINRSIIGYGLGLSVADINLDGYPDLYIGNDFHENDYLYINQKNGTFKDELETSMRHTSQFSMGTDIADITNDGFPEIISMDMMPEDPYILKRSLGEDEYNLFHFKIEHGYHPQFAHNALQLNRRNGLFSDIGFYSNVFASDWSWSALWTDFDNDGWKDLFISNGILRDMTNLDFVKYTSGYTADASKLSDPAEMWKVVKDMPSTKLTNYLFKNNHQLGFTNQTTDWGLTKKSVSNGAAYADLDNDGYPDLVINNLNDDATIYRNNGARLKPAKYLRVKLKGAGKNTFGIGAKVHVQTAHSSQVQEEYLSRGFQSSVDPVMHFGLATDSIIWSITVNWPGGKVSVIKNIKADTLLIIDEKDASAGSADKEHQPLQTMFKNVTASSGINFTDHPSKFVDFKISPLLPYQLSKTGPCLAKADVNGDGLEDVFVGASATDASVLYLQTADGKFISAASQPWAADKNITTNDALFFDPDGDGDRDLYLVSGGADYPINSPYYQDRVFENDGHGNFKKLDNALPDETISGSCARAADINKDGLPDIFVGGRVKPGFFPAPPESFILKNKSTPGNIRFERDTAQTDTLLMHPGMVTNAAWFDIDKDGWQDLVVVGEFMPVTIFRNHNGRLKDDTKNFGLANTQGWYHHILTADFDNDGDTDMIIGNMGDNMPLKASEKEPVSITYADFYGNGITDPILCYYNKGKSYPYYSRDEIASQVPSLQKKILHYADYADAQLSDLFNKEQLDNAKTVTINNTLSICLENQNNKKFIIKPLPAYAQLSAVNGLITADINNDGYEDVIAAGNFYPFRVEFGPLDAGIGVVLQGSGRGGFTPITYTQTGLCLQGDVRNIIRVNTKQKNGFFIVAACSNGQVQVWEKLSRK